MSDELKAQNKEALWQYLEGLKTGDPDRGLTNPEHDVLVVQWAVLRITELEQQLAKEHDKWKFRHERKVAELNIRHEKEIDTLREQLDECQKHRRLLMDDDLKFQTMKTMETEIKELRSQLQTARDTMREAVYQISHTQDLGYVIATLEKALAAGQEES